MGKHKQAGFTIIEVSLFLAISGLLAVLLLAGWTATINNQRFRDSVRSSQSFIQQQYSLVYAVENGRDSTMRCGSDNRIEVGSGGRSRGQSECVLLGRYIFIKDGTTMASSAVIGRDTSTSTSLRSDQTEVESISEFNPRRSDINIGQSETDFTIPWQSVISNNAGVGRSIAIAIIRSPQSGIVHTFVANVSGDTPPAVDSIISTANERQETMCFDAGTGFNAPSLAVRLAKGAASQDGVQVVEPAAGGCNG